MFHQRVVVKCCIVDLNSTGQWAAFLGVGSNRIQVQSRPEKIDTTSIRLLVASSRVIGWGRGRKKGQGRLWGTCGEKGRGGEGGETPSWPSEHDGGCQVSNIFKYLCFILGEFC